MTNKTNQRGNAVLVALIGLIGLVLSALISRGYFDSKEETQAAAPEATTAPEPTWPPGEEAPPEPAPAASEASASEPDEGTPSTSDKVVFDGKF